MSAQSKFRTALPDRYQHDEWMRPFQESIMDFLVPGMRILDVGSGCRPALPLDERPPGCEYVGLDLSADELRKAPSGSYHEAIVGDVTTPRDELRERFDLVISWQVLEHVKPLDTAIENIRSYLRPGGRFVGQWSGTFSYFALLSRLVPHRAATFVMHRLLGRDPASVFPAYYHRCWLSALMAIGRNWTSFNVKPLHAGGGYLAFAPPIQRMYLRYEQWIIDRQMGNLATHYVLIGDK